MNEYSRQTRPFETEYEMALGVLVRRTGGHTPGHSVVRLASGGDRLTLDTAVARSGDGRVAIPSFARPAESRAGDAVFQVGFEHPDWPLTRDATSSHLDAQRPSRVKGWFNGFEHDPEEAARVRASLFCGSWRPTASRWPLTRDAATPLLNADAFVASQGLVATHLSFPSVCHVAVDGDAFRWVPGPWEY